MSESMTELGFVFTIIGMAVVLGIRSIYRFMKKEGTGACRGCTSCTCDDTKKRH